jgi:hypothetical protein
MAKFTEKIYSTGANPYVNVPRRVSDALGGGGFVKIKGTLNGEPIRSALVPTGSRHRLYINDAIRRETGVETGDTVDLVIEPDREEDKPPTPDLLAKALMANPALKGAWQQLKPSRRREILVSLNSARTPDSLRRQVDKLVGRLTRS